MYVEMVFNCNWFQNTPNFRTYYYRILMLPVIWNVNIPILLSPFQISINAIQAKSDAPAYILNLGKLKFVDQELTTSNLM